jgi:hypothetical protein
VGTDVVYVQVAMLERPVDDPYINQELWTVVDEEAVPLDSKARLQENGLRVGVLGGLPPARLQKMLTSERGSANRRGISLHAEHSTTVALGPAVAVCRFQLKQNGQPTLLTFAQAECGLEITPTLTEDGRTRLRFTPRLQHGEPRMTPRPSEDQSGLLLQWERPVQMFPALSWEVTLAADQYAVMGGRSDLPETLGCQFFVHRDESMPVQRLLVLRTARASDFGSPEPAADGEEESSRPKVPPLAMQAAWTATRGR